MAGGIHQMGYLQLYFI